MAQTKRKATVFVTQWAHDEQRIERRAAFDRSSGAKNDESSVARRRQLSYISSKHEFKLTSIFGREHSWYNAARPGRACMNSGRTWNRVCTTCSCWSWFTLLMLPRNVFGTTAAIFYFVSTPALAILQKSLSTRYLMGSWDP